MTVVRKCASHHVKGIRKVCQLMERCDGHGGMLGGVGRCDNFQEV